MHDEFFRLSYAAFGAKDIDCLRFNDFCVSVVSLKLNHQPDIVLMLANSH